MKTYKEIRNIISTFRLISCFFNDERANDISIHRTTSCSILRFDINQKKKKERRNLISIHHCTRNDTAWGKRNLYQMILCGRPTDA